MRRRRASGVPVHVGARRAFLVAAAVVGLAMTLAAGGSGATTSPVESAIAWAQQHVGQNFDFEECQLFVHDAYYQAGVDIGWGASAVSYWTAHPGAQHPGDINPPRGALVYWGATRSPYNPYGHVGISLGGGQVISTYSYPKTTADPDAVHVFTIAARNAAGYPYLGWIAPRGVNVAQPGPVSMASYLGHIVHWDGDHKPQLTSWLVVSDGGRVRRRWIPDIATYWCLKGRGNPGPDVLSSAQLDAMPDETSVWASCDTSVPAGGKGGDGTTGLAEQAGHNGVRPFADFHSAARPGPAVAAGGFVVVACKVHDGNIASSNPDGYWYKLASDPWDGAYYAPANAFMNGDPWNGPFTHNTDFGVLDCGGASEAGSAPGASATGTSLEQEGHHGAGSFSNPHSASGGGPTVAAGEYVHVSCRLYDPAISSVNPDGYWYRIADSPWNNVYYAPANTFMNGDPWNGPYTHNTDFNVPTCGTQSSGGGGTQPSGGGGTQPSGGGGSVSVSNNNGQMAVQLASFPLGTTYFFCHAGNPSDYPTGGTVTAHGQVNITSPNESWASGLCSGGHSTNMWIGLQGTDGHDYYSNQVVMDVPASPGASVSISNNNGQMAVQVTGFPTGNTPYFCHAGDPSQYPTGGTVTAHGQVSITSPNASWASGLCSGGHSTNMWIGLQGTDGHDYYSNQVVMDVPASPGASDSVFGSNGQMSLQLSNFPQGTNYYFCHQGAPSQYPTGGSIIGHGQLNVTSPNGTYGPLCSGSGNAWIGVQGADGHDYYSNQITL
jgi:hypothetical protein